MFNRAIIGVCALLSLCLPASAQSFIGYPPSNYVYIGQGTSALPAWQATLPSASLPIDNSTITINGSGKIQATGAATTTVTNLTTTFSGGTTGHLLSSTNSGCAATTPCLIDTGFNATLAISGGVLGNTGYVTPTQYPYNDGNSPTQVGAGISSTSGIFGANITLVNNGAYPFRVFNENNQAIGIPGVTFTCTGGTGASQCGGLTFSVNISWTGQSTIPISYTGLSTDTPTTVANNFCTNLLANATLTTTANNWICDPNIGPGIANITWNVALVSVVVTPTGTGTIVATPPANKTNRDGVTYILDHYTPGYSPQPGDIGNFLELGSQGAVAQFTISDVTGAIGASYSSYANFNTLANGGIPFTSMRVGQGIAIPDSVQNFPAFQGYGTISLTQNGSIYLNGSKSFFQSGGSTAINTNTATNTLFETAGVTEWQSTPIGAQQLMLQQAVQAGGLLGLSFGTAGTFGIYWGSGVPSISASQGSLYLRTDGSSSSTRAYINTNGSTGWTNITTGS